MRKIIYIITVLFSITAFSQSTNHIPYQADVSFGTVSPPTNTDVRENDTYVVTSDGTINGDVLEVWVFDEDTNMWFLTTTPEIVTTLVNNNDGTFTYTSEDGTVTVYDETTTVISLNADNTNIDYTDENGLVTQLDLTDLVGNLETVTTLGFNTTTNFLEYVDENGVTTSLDLSSLASTVTDTNTNTSVQTIATHTANGVTTNIEETVTTIVDNNDGTYTYTSEDGTATTFEACQGAVDNFTATAGQTVFTASAPTSIAQVFKDRIFQIEGVDFTHLSGVITFNVPLNANDNVVIYSNCIIGGSSGSSSTPSQYTQNADGTVTLTSDSGSITINQTTTGTGAPTGTTPTGNPIYVDNSTGNVYTYDGTSWNAQGVDTLPAWDNPDNTPADQSSTNIKYTEGLVAVNTDDFSTAPLTLKTNFDNVLDYQGLNITSPFDADSRRMITFQRGLTANQRAYMAWVDHTGATTNLLGFNALNSFIAFDSQNQYHFISANSGSNTFINAFAAAPVVINSDGSPTSTGGLVVNNGSTGAATPLTYYGAIRSSGITAFNGRNVEALSPGNTHSTRILTSAGASYLTGSLSLGILSGANRINFLSNGYAPKFTMNTADGRFGVLTTAPTAAVDINSDVMRLRLAKTPASSTAAGNQGDIAWDSNYFYWHTGTSWNRIEKDTTW